jgi:putative DNA primase/helicase
MGHSSIPLTANEIDAYYATKAPKLKRHGTGEWRGPCPLHLGNDDNFSVNPETGSCTCHSTCGRGWDIFGLEMALTGADFGIAKAEVFRIVGRNESHPPTKEGPARNRSGLIEEARYPYLDRDGRALFEVVRYRKPDDDKTFKQGRRNIDGTITWNLDGIDRVPFNLPAVLNADTVYLVEGEKDALTLGGWGLVASCNPGGSGSTKLYARWADYFRERHVVIIPDNDQPGRKHALGVAEALLGEAASIRIVELPGLLTKGDVTDWKASGGTREELIELTEAAISIDRVKASELRKRWGLPEPAANQRRLPAADESGWPEPTANPR